MNDFAIENAHSGPLPLNICFVSQWRFKNLDQMPGKPISEAIRMAKELDRVVFVCYNDEGKYLSRKIGNNVFVYTVPFSMNLSLTSTLKSFLNNFTAMVVFLMKIVEIHQIDLIRAENVILGGIPSSIACKITRTRYAIWMAGEEDAVIRIRYGSGPASRFIDLIFKLLRRKILSKAEYVICVSSNLAKKSKEFQNRTYITPNFVDFEKFKPKELHQSRKKQLTFLYVGRLEDEKGIPLLLQAIETLPLLSNHKILIAGWGKYQPEVQKISDTHSNVEFLGKFSHSDMPKVYERADVLILPSITEGMPAALLEAMASGLVVLATNVGEIPNLVKDQVNGFLMKPGDINDFERCLTKIIVNYDSLDSLRASARLTVEEVSGNYVLFHKALYRQLIKEMNLNQ